MISHCVAIDIQNAHELVPNVIISPYDFITKAAITQRIPYKEL